MPHVDTKYRFPCSLQLLLARYVVYKLIGAVSIGMDALFWIVSMVLPRNSCLRHAIALVCRTKNVH